VSRGHISKTKQDRHTFTMKHCEEHYGRINASHPKRISESATFGRCGMRQRAQTCVLPQCVLILCVTSLGLSGLVHEKTHSCRPNFIQSIFETVQAGCINSVLVQTVPSVYDSIWEQIFPNISVKSWFTNFLTIWPRKPLSLSSSVN